MIHSGIQFYSISLRLSLFYNKFVYDFDTITLYKSKIGCIINTSEILLDYEKYNIMSTVLWCQKCTLPHE